MKNTVIAASLALALPGFAFAENTGVVSTGGLTVAKTEPVVVAPPVVVEPEARGTLPPYLPLLIAGGAALGAAALVLGSTDERDSSGATTTTTTN